MTRWRSAPLRLVAVLALAVAFAAACSSRSPAPTALRSTAPATTSNPSTPEAPLVSPWTDDGVLYQEPEVGSCHLVDRIAVVKAVDAAPPVSCSQPHTSVTFKAVLTGRNRVLDVTHLDRIYATVGRLCMNEAYETSTVGLTWDDLALTTFTFLVFLPTKEQQRHGARWIRCDVMAGLANSDRNPLRLPPLPLAGGVVPATLASCYHEYSGKYVGCDQAHTHVAAAAAGWTTRGTPWPGRAAVRKRAVAACSDALRGDAAQGQWRYSYPSAEQWRSGYAEVVCFERSSGYGSSA